MYIQNTKENREKYLEIFNEDVIEVIHILDYDDEKDVIKRYNKDFKFHKSHGTWKELCYESIFMWDVKSVIIIRSDIPNIDLFNYMEEIK